MDSMGMERITYLKSIQRFPSIRTLESRHAGAVEPAVFPVNDLFRAGDGKSFHCNEKTLEGQLRVFVKGVALSNEQSTEATVVH